MRWSTNPDRTRIAVIDDRRQICCLTLNASGVSPVGPGPSSLPGQPWDLLGWAGPDQVALWRQDSQGSEIQVVDVGQHPGPARTCQVMGRPARCAVTPAGTIEVLVAVSVGTRVMLFVYRSATDSYLQVEGPGDFHAVYGWDPATRLLAAGFDAGFRLYGYDEEVCEDIEIPWPCDVRPAAAATVSNGVIGLTGLTSHGTTVPGVLKLSGKEVRWFTGHEGFSAADTSPSGTRILGVRWRDEAFAYRILDLDGRALTRLDPPPGLAADLVFARDEDHLIGEHQSPVLPPAVVRFSSRGAPALPLSPTGPRVPVCDATWRLESRDGMPEWVLEPAHAQRGTVLFLHGGPGGCLTQSYDPVIAALLGSGWRVLGPNYPGSSGYGEEFEALGRGDWGGADADAIAGRLAAVRSESTGPVCLYGQSYGAYLALLVAATDPGIADSVAVWAPVTDISHLWRHSSGVQRRWLARELGDLRLDEDVMLERSPIRHARKLSQVPLLIGHGSNDDRCPVEQSRRLVAELNGHHRYLEDPAGAHPPSDWQAWAVAVVAHFALALVKEPHGA